MSLICFVHDAERNRTWISITADKFLSIRQASGTSLLRYWNKLHFVRLHRHDSKRSFKFTKLLSTCSLTFSDVRDERQTKKKSNKQGICVYKFIQLFGYLFLYYFSRSPQRSDASDVWGDIESPRILMCITHL